MHTWSQMVMPASMMFRSKSKQVCIKRFCRSSMSWIFVSHTLCCITPRISKCKAHDDPGPLWWSYGTYDTFFVISSCNITFSVFWLSQGSVATLIRSGGWSLHCHICRSFLNLWVKTALKSLFFTKLQTKISWPRFYGPRCRLIFPICAHTLSALLFTRAITHTARVSLSSTLHTLVFQTTSNICEDLYDTSLL